MITVQLGGVDKSTRTTTGVLKDRAKLLIHESLMTDNEEYVMTDFDVDMDGEDSKVDIVSRSVARGNSYQEYHSKIKGNNRCTGHSECDAILMEKGRVNAAPELYAGHLDAELIHEAAIGKVAGEQILKLRTLGLTEEEAARSRRHYGANRLEGKKQAGFFRQFLRNLNDPIIKILIAALVINIIIHLVVDAVAGVLIGILANIPLIGVIVGAVGGLVGLYFTISLVLSILDYFKVLK
jgi:magnesium-transporting ATPase (P-type)